MKNLNEIRRQKLDSAFANYNFGLDVDVIGSDGWIDDSSNDFIKIVYVEFKKETLTKDCSNSEKVSFHVLFKDNSSDIEEIYGLMCSNGEYIGESNLNKSEKEDLIKNNQSKLKSF